jgi:hypothetical protein
MSQIIEVDFRVNWRNPVHVRAADGFRERIYGPDDALECLNHRWPAEKGPFYYEAKHRCIAALCKRASAELARDRFVDAARETGILM